MSAGFTVPELEILSRDAILSPVATVRNAATEKLRYLSGYEQWDFVKNALLATADPTLIFVLAKAMLFVVNNEIGPQERAEVQDFVLRFLQHRRDSPLPRYVARTLFTVYAAALYLNWRLMIIAEDGGGGDDGGDGTGPSSSSSSSTVGTQVESLLIQYLQPAEIVECMVEVVNHFAKEDSRTSLTSVRISFCRILLPHFFKYAELHISDVGIRNSLELMNRILESIPRGAHNEPLITVTVTSEESIYVSPGTEWMPTLARCAANCGSYVTTTLSSSGVEKQGSLSSKLTRVSLRGEDTEAVQACLNFLKLASTVSVGDFASRQALGAAIDQFTSDLLQQAFAFVQLYQVTRQGFVLLAGLTILNNLFERDPILCGAFFIEHEWGITILGNVALALCERWEDDEHECRLAAMHFFFLLGHRFVPRWNNVSRSSSGESPDAEPTAAVAALESKIRFVFDAYLHNVIAKAHIREETVGLAESVALFSEESLRPLAEMMFCESIPLVNSVRSELETAVQQYTACLRLRRGERVPEDMLVSLMVVSVDSLGMVSTNDAAMFVANIVLSRIATIISTVALSIQLCSVFPTDTIIDHVVSFLHDMVASGDRETDDLLQCLSLSGGSVASGGDDGEAAQRGCGEAPTASIHLGVLRSLFQFASSVLVGDFARDRVVNESVQLITYIWATHSSEIPLLMDSIALLQQMLAARTSVPGIVHAEPLHRVIDAALRREIGLLSNFAQSPYRTERALEAREALICVIAQYLEAQSLVGFIVSEQLVRLFDLCSATLRSDAVQFFRDITAIARGCATPASVLILLDCVVSVADDIMNQLQCSGSPALRAQVFRAWASLCRLCADHLRTDNVGTVQCAFASLAFHTTLGYLISLEVPRIGGNSGVYVPPMSVTELEVYDLCTVIQCTCGGSWCNLGVMRFYGDVAVEGVLVKSVGVLRSVPVAILVSREDRRHEVFNAIESCLNLSITLKFGLEVQVVWSQLLEYLLQCLGYRFSHLVARCIRNILGHLLANPLTENFVSPSCFPTIVREIAVALSTTTLAQETFELAFDLLLLCYQRDSAACDGVMDQLLSYCSAYHRVRLRCMLMMMRTRSSAADAARQYLGVFTAQSKLPTLAAW